jgi:hypothetical protein
MTEKEAIDRAVEFVRAESLDVRYLSQNWLADRESECPEDLLETYRSVKSTFRNHWVVAFEIPCVPGEVRCPSTKEICVYDTGGVAVPAE